jgi:glycerophosphoryl diester phosphodiesterase
MTGRVSLVGHRGQPRKFPENSLEGFRHCLEKGIHYVETDVHITADGVPVLSHDASLLKLTGRQVFVADHNFDAISSISAGYPERFGGEYKHCRIASLAQFSDLLALWPDVQCFIELKEGALGHFGNRAIDLTMQALQPIWHQCIFISFEYDALVYAREHYDLPLGWVIPEWDVENQQKAQQLAPEYLLVDIDICPRQQSKLWSGAWRWVAYPINDAKQVQAYSGLGIGLLETDRYSDLLEESDLIEVSNDF